MPGRSALCSLALVCAVVSSAGASRLWAQSELADLREDVHGLTQQVNELSLRVELLEHENAELKASVGTLNKGADFATTAQLNAAVADLNAVIKTSVATSRTEILEHVAVQMEVLAKQTNAALDSMAKSAEPASSRTAVSTAGSGLTKASFGDSYPKTGIKYSVQKGDTVALIAKKTGARIQDIIDANRLADPARIQVGQVLFVPKE
ncbi:MAG TPA: LysM peptidoglycan-binding domain-containing protein [Opitutaceae bacterium]|jgi:LysM repeat protein